MRTIKLETRSIETFLISSVKLTISLGVLTKKQLGTGDQYPLEEIGLILMQSLSSWSRYTLDTCSHLTYIQILRGIFGELIDQRYDLCLGSYDWFPGRELWLDFSAAVVKSRKHASLVFN